MEQTVDSQPTKRTRVSRKNNNVVKTFLETCILEIALNGKEGGSLKSLSWKKVADTLKDVHNFIVDREQMRNHFDYLSGHAYTQELLHGPSIQCQELMRMSRDAYVLLCNHFKQKEWVKDGRYVSVEEKMAMFLTMLGHNERYRVIKRRFQRSTETIHNCFHEVLRGCNRCTRRDSCTCNRTC